MTDTLALPWASGGTYGALLSAYRLYRYRLWRCWDPTAGRCAFVMVNPSTADESEDDATIRKCIGFAKRWGYGAIDVVNLFAWRSTDVTALLTAADPVGPENDEHLHEVMRGALRVVLAWGKHPPKVRRLVRARLDRLEARDWLAELGDVVTFGRNEDGTPRHPLMLAYATPLEAP